MSFRQEDIGGIDPSLKIVLTVEGLRKSYDAKFRIDSVVLGIF